MRRALGPSSSRPIVPTVLALALVVACVGIVGAQERPAPAGGSPPAVRPGGGTPTPAVPARWRRVTSPHGRYTVELPEGWELKRAEPDVLRAGPAGRETPSVGVTGWISADTFYTLLTGRAPDASLYCRQIPAPAFYGKILVPLLQRRIPDLKLDRLAAGASPAVAVAEGRGSFEGRLHRFVDVVSVEYVPDDTLLHYGCGRTWWTFPFISGLIATPDAIDGLKPVAGRIFATFTPAPVWGAEVRAALFDGIQTRLQMIGRTLSNINRMQMDQTLRELDSTRRIGQRWVDVLGGVARWKDPATATEGTIPWGSMPPGATKWWMCPGQSHPVASSVWPGSGCYEVPAPR